MSLTEGKAVEIGCLQSLHKDLGQGGMCIYIHPCEAGSSQHLVLLAQNSHSKVGSRLLLIWLQQARHNCSELCLQTETKSWHDLKIARVDQNASFANIE